MVKSRNDRAVSCISQTVGLQRSLDTSNPIGRTEAGKARFFRKFNVELSQLPLSLEMLERGIVPIGNLYFQIKEHSSSVPRHSLFSLGEYSVALYNNAIRVNHIFVNRDFVEKLICCIGDNVKLCAFLGSLGLTGKEMASAISEENCSTSLMNMLD